MVEEGRQHMDDNLYEAARRGRNIPGDINDQQLRSRTPGDYNNVLHVAAQYSNIHSNQQFITLTIARLGEHRCELLCQQNTKGETPLHLAAQFGNLEIVRLLLNAHDDAQLNTDALFANQKKPCWNERDKQGNTPLHKALQFGHEDIALLLLEMDFQVVSIDNSLGESVAFLAAENFCKRFLSRILNEDHFSGGVSLSGSSGQTVFHSARRLKDDIMESLIHIRGGTSLLKARETKKGRTVVHYAAKEDRIAIVKKLLRADSSLAYLQDNNGWTPLHIACKTGLLGMVRTILDLSPQSVEIRDNNGKTALHVAKMNIFFMRQCLRRIEMQVLINEVDSDGNTPLRIALNNYKYKVAFALMAINSCNWRLKNNKGQNALSLKKSSGNSSIISPVYIVLSYLQYKQLKVWERKIIQYLGTVFTWIGSLCSANLSKMEDEVLEKLQNKVAIAAALLIPLLFAVAFNAPGGYDSTGEPVLGNKRAFKFFMVSDSVAIMTAMVTLVFCTFGFGKRVDKKRLAQTNIFLLRIALLFTSLAYGSGLVMISGKVSQSTIYLSICVCMLGLIEFWVISQTLLSRLP